MENDAVLLCPLLHRNIEIFRERLNVPQNADVILRRFQSGAFESALLAIDGMVNATMLNENVLKPCMDLPKNAGEDAAPCERISFLMQNAVSILPMKIKDNIDDILADALSGQSVLLCEGCAVACVMDTRGFDKRAVSRPEAEKVVLGAHESFTESIRTNITLLRRIVQREDLITEFISVGGKMKTRVALLYLRGTADETILARIRKRLMACGSDFPLTAGQIEQLIESHPFALIPQSVRTERPDRAASFLAEGQVVVLTDGAPAALGAPATIYHQLHTPDDASMRWQYGTFLRLVRMLGIAIHLFLPGLYLAVLRFHPELLSAMLLTSVYETSSRVPFPVFLEALLMTLAFDLISEAGLRAPGALGNALGIVSGLILGQSAVSADIVSPLLLIVIAASGLGGFCVPGYALGVGLKIVQLSMMLAGAVGGLYAIGLLTLCLFCALCQMNAVGSPLTAPVTPHRPKNPDILLRLPVRFQKAKSFFARQSAPAPAKTNDVRKARVRSSFRARACTAGLCVGAYVFALGTGLAMPLCLNAAWIAALAALPACALAVWLARRRLVDSLAQKTSRVQRALLSLSLLLCCVFLLGALINLAEQTFLTQARTVFILLITLLLVLLGALCGGVGTSRTAFAMRFLPGLLPLLLLLSGAPEGLSGLYPLLGAGGNTLLIAAAFMLTCAAPAALLMIPPEEADGLTESDVPGVGFFLWRVLLGAGIGVLLLFACSLCSTYEAVAAQHAWGERLRITSASRPHQGLLQAFLTLGEVSLLALSASALLSFAERSLSDAFAPLARFHSGLLLLALLAGGALLAFVIHGFDGVFVAAASAIVPVAIALGWKRRKKR